MIFVVSIIILIVCLAAFVLLAYICAYDYVCEQLDHCNYFGEDL